MTEQEQQTLTARIEEISDLSWNAQKNLLKATQERLEQDMEKPAPDHSVNRKPDTFYHVMADVIDRNMFSAAGRYGRIKTVGLLFNYVLKKIKG